MKKLLLSVFLVGLLSSFTTAQIIVLYEDFNTNALPTGWSTNIATGVDDWVFGTNGSSNLNGDGMAYFDDDALTSSAPFSRVELFTPAIDMSSYILASLEFDYNFNSWTPPDAFEVEVFDGTNWINVLSILDDDCGSWGCASIGNYPHAVIDITPYLNANFQVKFIYDDGDNFSWYVGIDNVSLQTPAPDDAGVTEIFVGSCGLTSSELVTVDVTNFGTNAATNLTMVLNVDGNTIATETFAGPIQPGQTEIYTFTATADLSALGSHTVIASGSVANDANAVNNETSLTFNNEAIVNSYPYLEDFDDFTSCIDNNCTNNCQGVMFGGWSNSANDGFDWSVNSGATSSFGTGPSGDHTSGSGQYLYTERGFSCSLGAEAWVQSPCFDLSSLTTASDVRVGFWYHMLGGTGMGTLTLQIDTTTTGTWMDLWTETGNQGNQWKQMQLSIANYLNNGTVRFRLVGEFGSGSDSDIAIDDFQLYPVFSDNFAVVNITAPSTTACTYNNAETVKAQIRNFGLNTPADSTIEISMWVDGIFQSTQTLANSLTPGPLLTVTIDSTADLSAPGEHTITIAVSVPGEGFPNNDTLTKTFGGALINTYPYEENFDTWTVCLGPTNCSDGACAAQITSPGWSNVVGGFDGDDWRIWSGSTNTPGTGPTSDHTTGNGQYVYIESTGCTNLPRTLETPCFDLSTLDAPILSFWYHMYGATTGSVSLQIDPGTGTFITVSGQANEQGDQWHEFVYDLSNYTNQLVRFRIIGIAGGGMSDIAIDDFRIGESPAFDAGVTALIGPEIGNCQFLTSTEIVTIEFENFGADTLTNVQFSLEVNDVPVASESWTGILPPGQTTNYSFSTPVDLTAGGFLTLTATAAATPIDERPWNNENSFTAFNDGGLAISTFPYLENFDSWANCGSGFNCTGDDVCTNLGTLGWHQTIGDDSDWAIESGSTGSINTGPTDDHTQGANGNGKYLYTEASICVDNEMSIMTPCLDFTALDAPEASFWYHMWGSDMGMLELQIDTTGLGNWNTIWTISGDQGNQWLKAVVDLTPYAGTVAKLRWKGTTGGGIGSDMAIDDFLLREVLANDLQILNVTGPQDGCGDEQVYLDVTIFNYGYTTESDFSIVIDALGNPSQTVQVDIDTLPLVNEDSTIITIGPFNTAAGGQWEFTATITSNTATDLDPSNDSDSYSYTSFAIPYPTAIDSSSCGAGEVVLGATGPATQYFWYEEPTGGQWLDTGAFYTTPFLTQTDTFWIEGRNPFNDHVGPTDRTAEDGGYYDFYTDGLVFNALFDFTLNSVKVFPLFPGDIVITIEDASGNVVYNETFAFGGTVIDTILTLNAGISQGSGYKIHATGSTTEMYRNRNTDNNFGIVYPYVLDGAVAITGPINNEPGTYYFFYDWEVTFLGCPSPREPAIATVGPSGLLISFELENFASNSITADGSAIVIPITGQAPYTYLWSTGETAPTATMLAGDSTIHTVTITDANGCNETFSIPMYTVNTTNISAIQDLGIYPNPSTGQFTIDLKLSERHDVEIAIFNILGQKVHTFESAPVTAQQYVVDLDDMAAGMYQVRIRIDDQLVTKPVMVVRN